MRGKRRQKRATQFNKARNENAVARKHGGLKEMDKDKRDAKTDEIVAKQTWRFEGKEESPLYMQ